MRIALIADIHGNRVALDAVLVDIERWEPDRIVCLGDVALTGPQPLAVLDRLRALGCPVVQGNADEWLLQPEVIPVETDDHEKIEDIAWWCLGLLREEDRAFLATFHPTVEVRVETGDSLLCFHGSPRSNQEIMLAGTPDADLAPMIAGVSARYLAGGHTHTPMLRRYRQGQTILNPGSVGLPYHRPGMHSTIVRPAWAEYLRIDTEDGITRYEFRAVPIDLAALARAVGESGMPHANWWISGWRP